MHAAVRLMEDRYCTTSDALDLVEMAFALRFGGNTKTLDKYVGTARRFFLYASRSECSTVESIDAALVADFIESPAKSHGRVTRPKPKTKSFRRSVVKAVIEELAHLGVVLDPTIIGDPIRCGEADRTRPMTEAELDAVRSYCNGLQRLSRVPVIVSLCEAGGRMPEIAAVRVEDLDLGAGTVTFTFPRVRTTALTPWGVETISYALERSGRTDGELFPGGISDPDRIGHILTVQTQKMLRACRVRAGSGVSSRSIALGVAAQINDERGFLAAAKHLGMESQLNAVAAALGIDWDEV